MRTDLRIAYLAHSIRSDWNNGNAHFLRGLARALMVQGHTVRMFEPDGNWSTQNLAEEADGQRSMTDFGRLYSELDVRTYNEMPIEGWRELLRDTEVVILHEWNPPELAQTLLTLRDELRFALLFHDTHHRASSSPEQIERFGIHRFDGVIAFGEVLRDLYAKRFGIARVWVLHEAADTTIFHPILGQSAEQDVVWIGNWGDDERSEEIDEFLLTPARRSPELRCTIYGVRYPEDGLRALASAGVRYGGYLPNADAPSVYARSGLTVHVPRRQYATSMVGIPTIRVFEALACGIPLISAPWQDVEGLFRPGDMSFVQNGAQMSEEINRLLREPERAVEQARRGLETILARHTCGYRAIELTAICNEVLQ